MPTSYSAPTLVVNIAREDQALPDSKARMKNAATAMGADLIFATSAPGTCEGTASRGMPGDPRKRMKKRVDA